MKNFFYLLLCVGLFTFASCNDDDDDEPSLTEANIEGTWNLDRYDNDYTIDITGTDAVNGSSEISNSNVTMTFTSSSLTWTSTGDFTLTLTDSDSTTTENITGGIGSGTYSVENGNLVLVGIDSGDETDSDAPTVFRPTSYNPDSELKADGDIDVTIMDPLFGLTVSIDGDIKMELSR